MGFSFSRQLPTPMTNLEKQLFWQRFDERVTRIKGRVDPINLHRVEQAEQDIKTKTAEIFEKHYGYAEEVSEYDSMKLMNEIQPKWSLYKRGKLSDEFDTERMLITIMDYKLRGMDFEYFTNGFGAD